MILSDNNKIITNNSGEILYEPDELIDVNTKNSVIKNISNEVISVRNGSLPYNLNTKNIPCIENGDGFDFSANSAGYLGKVQPFEDLAEWTFQFWFKAHADNINQNQAICFYFAGTTGAMYAQVNTAKQFNFYTGALSISSSVISNLSAWNHFAVVGGVNFGHRFFVNGYSDGGTLNGSQGHILKSNNRVGYVGSRGYTNSYILTDYIDDIQLVKKAIYPQANLGEFVFTPPTRSSE